MLCDGGDRYRSRIWNKEWLQSRGCASQNGSHSVASLRARTVAVPTPAEAASGALLDRRYRLDELLSEAEGMRLARADTWWVSCRWPSELGGGSRPTS